MDYNGSSQEVSYKSSSNKHKIHQRATSGSEGRPQANLQQRHSGVTMLLFLCVFIQEAK